MQQANDFDKLLALVIRQAQAVHIPIAAQIDAHVAVNTRAKKRFGQCIFYQGRYTIELSSMMLYAPEKSCCQTLAHELIHTCPGCQNHDPLFQQYAAVMNRQYGYHIQRTNTPEELVTQGISFLSGLAQTLQSHEATEQLVNTLVETNEQTGECTLRIPVPDKQTVTSLLNLVGKLLGGR